jgi:hypothetical protein
MSGDALAVPEISKDLEKEEALEPLFRVLIHNDGGLIALSNGRLLRLATW